jgi:hypothetical protein
MFNILKKSETKGAGAALVIHFSFIEIGLQEPFLLDSFPLIQLS